MSVFAAMASVVSVPEVAESDTSIESSILDEPATALLAAVLLLLESRFLSVSLSMGESRSMFMSSSGIDSCLCSVLSMFLLGLGSVWGVLRFLALMSDKRESLGGEHEGEEEEEEDEDDPPPMPEWTKWSLSAWSCIARIIVEVR